MALFATAFGLASRVFHVAGHGRIVALRAFVATSELGNNTKKLETSGGCPFVGLCRRVGRGVYEIVQIAE